MSWSEVGSWLKDNGKGLLGLAGSIATGNVPGAVASVAGMVQSATGENSPVDALMQLQNNPEAMVRLKEIAAQNEAEIRNHARDMHQMELEDAQKEHSEQQQTIRAGDNATDEYVRRTRPKLARYSFYGSFVYMFLMEALSAFGKGEGASWELVAAMMAPAMAYMGYRSADKWSQAKHGKGIGDTVRGMMGK